MRLLTFVAGASAALLACAQQPAVDSSGVSSRLGDADRSGVEVGENDSSTGMPAGVKLTVLADSVRVVSGGEWFRVAIPFQLLNRSDFTLGAPGCRQPRGPEVETLTDSGWIRWKHEYDLCDSPPGYIPPGGVVVDTTQASGCTGPSNCSPPWIGPAESTLRLVWRLYPVRERPPRSSELSRGPYIEVFSAPFVARLITS